MRCLLLAATFLLTLSAHAQRPTFDMNRFAELQVGNRWEYMRTQVEPAPPFVTGYAAAAVVGETVIDGVSYFVLTQQAFDANRIALGAPAHCAYSPTLGVALASSTSLPDYECAGQMALPPQIPFVPFEVRLGQSIEISGDSVAVDSLLWFGEAQYGEGNSSSFYAKYYATGIGYVSSRNWGRGHASTGGTGYDLRTTLVYALIDGETYGTRAVADEPPPSGQALVSVSAYPNPSSASFRVVTTGMSGAVVLDVFDALGRRVGGGVVDGGEAFDVRPDAAGVYVVRARDDAGQTASVRVVRQ